MVDAGAAVVGFVMSTISWYGMLRNGAQTIYDDAYTLRNFSREVEQIKGKAESQRDEMLVWQEKWMLFRGAPDLLYQDFWGTERFQRIRTTLEGMNDDFQRVRHQLESLGLETTIADPNLGCDCDTAADHAQIMGHWSRDRFTCWKRMRWMLLQKKHLNDLLNKLGEKLEQITRDSEMGWTRLRPNNVQNVDFDAVYHDVLQKLLTPIACGSVAETNALRDSCANIHTLFKTEMELNIFNVGREDAHRRAIGRTTKCGRLHLNILTRQGPVATQMRVRKTLESDLEALELKEIQQAFSQIVSGNTTPWKISAAAGIDFKVAQGDPNRPARNTRTWEAARRFFSEDHLSNQVSSRLAISWKSRLAYELSLACFVFYRSQWFSGVCGCELRSAELLTGPGTARDCEFSLAFVADHDQITCWQDQWDRDIKPLRRLGLVLVEIVLGKQVSFKWERDQPISEITLAGNREPTKVDEILQLVYDSMGKSLEFRNTVEVCLVQLPSGTLRDGYNDTQLLCWFYEIVVRP